MQGLKIKSTSIRKLKKKHKVVMVDNLNNAMIKRTWLFSYIAVMQRFYEGHYLYFEP